MVRKHAQLTAGGAKVPPPLYASLGRIPNRPLDMPIYKGEFMKIEPLPAK